MRKIVSLTTLAVATAIMSTLPTAAQAQSESSTDSLASQSAAAVAYIKTPAGNEVYQVTNPNTAQATVKYLSHAEWVRLGSPWPTTSQATNFVKYPWQDNVYAVNFFGPNRSQWAWQNVSFPTWVALGQPKPRVAGWIQGSTYSTPTFESKDVYVSLAGKTHLLTFNEWLAAGAPQPTRPKPKPKPTPTVNPYYLKLSWNDQIAKTTNPSNPMWNSTIISSSQWASAGSPAPTVKSSFPGDVLYHSCGSDALIYSGPTFEGVVSPAQWAAMSYRTPLSCQAARDKGLSDAKAYLTSQGISGGIAVFDNQSKRAFSVNGSVSYSANSTAKLLYTSAMLKQIQDSGRAPNATERDLVWRAITQSDNDAAAAIFSRIGGQSGAQTYANYIGLNGETLGAKWGWAKYTPMAGLHTVNVVTYGGSGLNASNTEILRNAMRNVTSSQRWGTPATSAEVALKNGWNSSTGPFEMATIHSVRGAGRDYTASFYTYTSGQYKYQSLTAASQRLYRMMG